MITWKDREEYKKFYNLFLEMFFKRYNELEISYGGKKNFSVYNNARPYYDGLVVEFKNKYNVEITSGLLDIQKHYSKIHKEKNLQSKKTNNDYKNIYWETINNAIKNNDDIFGFLRDINKVNIGENGILNLNEDGYLKKYYNKETIEKNINVLLKYKNISNEIDQIEKPQIIIY